MSTFELGITPPPGVAFVQWGDGTIRIRYATKDVVPIRKMLIQLAKSLTEQAVTKLKEEREAEIAKQRMPLSRLQKIQQEMKMLQGEMATVEQEAIDLAAFEEAVEVSIADAVSDSPTVIPTPDVPVGPTPVPASALPMPNLPIPTGEPVVVIGKVSRDFDVAEFED